MTLDEALKAYRDEVVVIDVAPPVVYIGRLAEADAHFVTLREVDVHELQSASVTKEVYVMEARRNGVQPTRQEVKIKASQVLSLSRLEDTILF
jgi:hypothetical protein